MSLSKCAECGKDISTHASKCPHCGVPSELALPQLTECAECDKEFNLLANEKCPNCGAPKDIARKRVAIKESEMIPPPPPPEDGEPGYSTTTLKATPSKRPKAYPALLSCFGVCIVVLLIPLVTPSNKTPLETILDEIPEATQGEFPTPESAVEFFFEQIKSENTKNALKVLPVREVFQKPGYIRNDFVFDEGGLFYLHKFTDPNEYRNPVEPANWIIDGMMRTLANDSKPSPSIIFWGPAYDVYSQMINMNGIAMLAGSHSLAMDKFFPTLDPKKLMKLEFIQSPDYSDGTVRAPEESKTVELKIGKEIWTGEIGDWVKKKAQEYNGHDFGRLQYTTRLLDPEEDGEKEESSYRDTNVDEMAGNKPVRSPEVVVEYPAEHAGYSRPSLNWLKSLKKQHEASDSALVEYRASLGNREIIGRFVMLKFGSNWKILSGDPNMQYGPYLGNPHRLIMAMSVIHAREREEQIQLPRHGGSSLSNKERPFVINVTRDGTYIVRGEIVDLDHLRVLLRETYSDNPERKVLIRGDADALHSQSTAALAACSETGFATAMIAWDTSLRR